MLRFLIKAVLVAIVIITAAFVGSDKGLFAEPSFLYFIVVFLTLSTILIYSWTSRRVKARPLDFVNIYLSSTVLRMLLYGVFIAIIIVLDKEGAEENALLFLACYFGFTILEVIVLFREVKTPLLPHNRGQKDL